jgi:16S rRNA (uracil1498-N3)-methyltransferase
MTLPIFYIEESVTSQNDIVLNETTSKHIIQVLRMQKGEKLQLTDGLGNLHTAEITDDNRKKCLVKIIETVKHPKPGSNVSIAISLIKNNSRFEWFLEKATEIGVSEIIPLICERTEKQNFRLDRMKTILVSAMLQSQQTWLPALYEPIKFTQFITSAIDAKKMIAHCEEGENKRSLVSETGMKKNKLILIGPEGDFSTNEVEAALANNFTAVALGETRLRTETAGIVAASLLCNL